MPPFNVRDPFCGEALRESELATVYKYPGYGRWWNEIDGKSRNARLRERRKKFVSLFEAQQNPLSCTVQRHHKYSIHTGELDKLLFVMILPKNERQFYLVDISDYIISD